MSRVLFISFIILANATLLQGCGFLTKRSPEPNPLIVASCPKLTPLVDDSFGTTVQKLTEVAGIYYECRAAAGVQ
jgi:hypothetical protein